MNIVPFRAEHIEALRHDPTQEHIGYWIGNPEHVSALEQANAWTALDGDRVLGCAGLNELWPGHHEAWALLHRDIGGRGMIFATRAINRMLALQSGRIQAFVEASFIPAQRWMTILGFERETPGVLRQWFPDGADAILYSRITPWPLPSP